MRRRVPAFCFDKFFFIVFCLLTRQSEALIASSSDVGVCARVSVGWMVSVCNFS